MGWPEATLDITKQCKNMNDSSSIIPKSLTAQVFTLNKNLVDTNIFEIGQETDTGTCLMKI